MRKVLCEKDAQNNVHGCAYRKHTITTLPAPKTKQIPIYCTVHNIYCVHQHIPVLKTTCLYGCGGKRDSMDCGILKGLILTHGYKIFYFSLDSISTHENKVSDLTPPFL